MGTTYKLYGWPGSGSFAVQVALEELAVPYERIWVARARFLQWMVFLSANVYESVLRIFYAERYSTRGSDDAAAIAAKATEDYFAQLAMLSQNLAPYVLGSEYSLADVYLYMLASWSPGEPGELQRRLPGIGAHAALVKGRPAVVKVEADHA